MKLDERNIDGFTVELHTDDDSESPLEWDNAWTFIGGRGCPYLLNDGYAYDFSDPDYLAMSRNPGDVVAILSVRDYGSQGGSISRAECLEDANAIAVISRETIAEEWGGDMAKAYQYLEGIIETYQQYLDGEVYGYVVGGDVPADMMDSCWGFYGESDAWSEGESAARWIRAEIDNRNLMRGLSQVGYAGLEVAA